MKQNNSTEFLNHFVHWCCHSIWRITRRFTFYLNFTVFVRFVMVFNYSNMANLGFRTYSNMFWIFWELPKFQPNLDPRTPYLSQKHFKNTRCKVQRLWGQWSVGLLPRLLEPSLDCSSILHTHMFQQNWNAKVRPCPTATSQKNTICKLPGSLTRA